MSASGPTALDLDALATAAQAALDWRYVACCDDCGTRLLCPLGEDHDGTHARAQRDVHTQVRTALILIEALRFAQGVVAHQNGMLDAVRDAAIGDLDARARPADGAIDPLAVAVESLRRGEREERARADAAEARLRELTRAIEADRDARAKAGAAEVAAREAKAGVFTLDNGYAPEAARRAAEARQRHTSACITADAARLRLEAILAGRHEPVAGPAAEAVARLRDIAALAPEHDGPDGGSTCVGHRDLVAVLDALSDQLARARWAEERLLRANGDLGAMRAERDEAVAIVAGREVAPTEAELDAQHAARGGWLLAWYGAAGTATEVVFDRRTVRDALVEAASLDGLFLALPLGPDRRPSDWPQVTP